MVKILTPENEVAGFEWELWHPLQLQVFVIVRVADVPWDKPLLS